MLELRTARGSCRQAKRAEHCSLASRRITSSSSAPAGMEQKVHCSRFRFRNGAEESQKRQRRQEADRGNLEVGMKGREGQGGYDGPRGGRVEREEYGARQGVWKQGGRSREIVVDSPTRKSEQAEEGPRGEGSCMCPCSSTRFSTSALTAALPARGRGSAYCEAGAGVVVDVVVDVGATLR